MKRYNLVIENNIAYLNICDKWCYQIIKDSQISVHIINWSPLTDNKTLKRLEKK